MKPARNVCLVLANEDAGIQKKAVLRPPGGVDVFEIRIDCLKDRDRTPEQVADIVKSAARPVIATCRPGTEGGRFHEEDDRREQLLLAALAAGAQLVDIEWSWLRRDPLLHEKFPWERVQLSHHHQGAFSSTVQDIFAGMLRTNARALKLVARADSFDQALQLLNLTEQGVRSNRRVSCFALGPAARVSRILSCTEGAFLTYVTSDDVPVVPGMLTLEEAVRVYRLGDRPYPVKLLGVLGYPLDGSLSPFMHNRVLQILGERYLYIPFACPEPGPIIDFMKDRDVRGLSVTIPHKVSIIPHLHGLADSARAAGAVNTIVRDGSRLIGHNTDLGADRQLLDEWGIGSGHRAVVIGAGGGARAVVRALKERQVGTAIVNRDHARASELAREFQAEALEMEPAKDGSFDLVVNATPLGARGEPFRFPLPSGEKSGVIDLAYQIGGTPLSRSARSSGVRTCDGLDFLARQGALQYALWAGRLVSPALYRNVLAEVRDGALTGESDDAALRPTPGPAR